MTHAGLLHSSKMGTRQVVTSDALHQRYSFDGNHGLTESFPPPKSSRSGFVNGVIEVQAAHAV